ncbi:hypothetical protein CMETHOX_38750 [Lacrimispora indolis]|nr:hypothetical protein CMETHOX_38750 [[Clostridium] methoxybenzovorans]
MRGNYPVGLENERIEEFREAAYCRSSAFYPDEKRTQALVDFEALLDIITCATITVDENYKAV